MKKILSVMISVLIVLLSSAVAFAALESDDVSDNPVIIVPGYSSSQMIKTNEDGTTEHAWGIDMDEIWSMVLHNIAEVGTDLGMLALGKTKYIADTVGKGAVELYGDLACNPDGSSISDLSLYYTTAEETCSATLEELYPNGNFQHEAEIMGEIATYINGGKSMIFNYNCDFRMSAVDCAARLDEYIEDVLAYTGKDKVNIVAISHGGQITATYLTLYGYKRQVDNTVMAVPAIGGAVLAYDAMRGDVDFDEETLVRFIEHGMMEETDYNWLVKAQRLGFLDDIIDGVLPYFYEIMGNWESIWDFIPTEYYEETKALRLDEVENAALIASSDYMHYTIMPQIGEGLRRCNEEYGMNVSIIAGTDNPSVSGLDVNSDGIISTSSSTGATVAPFGYRFSDGYSAINGDNSLVSPAMTVDASTAYLPDNTWFVDGLFHGMVYKDRYTIDLMMKLALTDDITSVYSDENYSRFHATTNKSSSVFAAFNNSAEGRVSSQDTALVITNLSEKYTMKILAVTCDGMNLKFNTKGIGGIAAGGSAEVCFTGDIPTTGMTHCGVTVTYLLEGSVTPVNERALSFIIDNGDCPEYDGSEPYTAQNYYAFDDNLDSYWSGILDDLGLKQIISILFNIFTYLFSHVFSL